MYCIHLELIKYSYNLPNMHRLLHSLEIIVWLTVNPFWLRVGLIIEYIGALKMLLFILKAQARNTFLVQCTLC